MTKLLFLSDISKTRYQNHLFFILWGHGIMLKVFSVITEEMTLILEYAQILIHS